MAWSADTPVYVLARVPGATETVEWKTICHSKTPFYFVTHEPLRWISRWASSENKRPFMVYYKSHHNKRSSHASLAAAIKAAKKFATEA